MQLSPIRVSAVMAAICITAGCSERDATNTDSAPTAALKAAAAETRLGMDNDIALVDGFLSKWDRFAQGENDLVPQIKELTPDFQQSLIRLLNSRDPRAPARLVFYAVVQVGGSVDVDSELGRAAKPILGDDFAITTSKDGGGKLFAGDLYFWWHDHKNEFQAYPLFDQWNERDFAKATVVPMYEQIRQNE